MGWGKGKGSGRKGSPSENPSSSSKGSKGSGWHIQAPPQDKTDPDWQPRRGGKKAKKQKLLFERRYNEFLASQGIPDSIEVQSPGSQSSGFPDFPGTLEQLAEVEAEETVDVVIEEEVPATPIAVPLTPQRLPSQCPGSLQRLFLCL